jgi:hypothetical protein
MTSRCRRVALGIWTRARHRMQCTFPFAGTSVVRKKPNSSNDTRSTALQIFQSRVISDDERSPILIRSLPTRLTSFG